MIVRAPNAGAYARRPAIERFAEKCRFDPVTGCVLWIGGKTRGRGNTATYGSFWYDGTRWFAHRWAGVFIHGLDLDGLQAGHRCPHGPDTLCVQHIVGQTQRENLDEALARLGRPDQRKPRAGQSNLDRQFWFLVERGYETPPEPAANDPADIPFYQPPDWLRPYLVDGTVNSGLDCPF